MEKCKFSAEQFKSDTFHSARIGQVIWIRSVEMVKVNAAQAVLSTEAELPEAKRINVPLSQHIIVEIAA